MQISSAILCFVLYAYVIIAAVYFGISFYAYRLVDNNEYDRNIQMGEEIFITCTRNYEWVCALFIVD